MRAFMPMQGARWWGDAPCVRGRAHFDEMQASGLAAVLLQPGQRLRLRIDVTYLLPLQDKVRSRALEPTTMLCTSLTSVSTHSPTPLASHHLLTLVISCILLQVVGDHCGTGIIGIDIGIFDRLVHVLVLSVPYAF